MTDRETQQFMIVLQQSIFDFLRERRESKGGGWAQVTTADVEQLQNIIGNLLVLKCELDADGDLPIEVTIVNRRTHQRLQFSPVPYGRLLGDGGDDEKRMHVALRNLREASEEARMAIDIFQSAKRSTR